MYHPEFIARIPASRTSSFTKTRESWIFFISLTSVSLGDVDPLSGPRRFQRSLDDSNRFCAVSAIHQRRPSRFNRIQKRDQFCSQRFFRRKLELLSCPF